MASEVKKDRKLEEKKMRTCICILNLMHELWFTALSTVFLVIMGQFGNECNDDRDEIRILTCP